MKDNFRFDNFIEAGSNVFAAAACIYAAESSEVSFNPIWINGPSGCGKTHLLKALCTAAAEHGRDALYVNAEDAGQAILSQIHGQPYAWERMERAEVLAIDDIDFFMGKDVTQQSFVELIDKKRLRGDVVVIASQHGPRVFPVLLSEFRNSPDALNAEIFFPEPLLRRKLIKRYLKASTLSMTQRAVKTLCEAELTVSQLEGALRSAGLCSSQSRTRVNAKWIKEYIKKVKE